jgi:hypothetical protein
MASRLCNRFIFKGSYNPAEAAVSEAQHTYAEALAAHPHALSTKYAFVWVIDKLRATRIDGVIMHKFPESLGIELDSQEGTELLQLARAILGTMSAINRMAR